ARPRRAARRRAVEIRGVTIKPLPPTPMTAVFLDYDQSGLDAAYDQTLWASNMEAMLKGYASASAKTRERLGAPRRFRYGPTAVEELDVFRASADEAAMLIFVHGVALRR